MKFLKPILVASIIGLYSKVSLAIVDPAAPAVMLRTNCQEAGSTLNNCFISMESLLTWLQNTRRPSAANPLLVQMGPGSFGTYTCDDSGHTTFNGAGRNVTAIAKMEVGHILSGSSPGCTNLEFNNLTIGSPSVPIAVSWYGAGNSSYHNVDVVAGEMAWWDFRINTTPQSSHYWWNSMFTSNPNSSSQATLVSYGSNHRLYGSEINAFVGNNEAQGIHLANAAVNGEIQMYGSSVRVKAIPGSGVTTLVGVNVGGDQAFHAHGGSLSVDATAAAGTNVAVRGVKTLVLEDLTTSSIVHMLDVAYALKPKGTGTISRIQGTPGVNINAPFYWGAGTAPPPLFGAPDGQDMFVEYDCSATGCQSAGTQPHLLIFSKGCTSKWFDVVTGACR